MTALALPLTLVMLLAATAGAWRTGFAQARPAAGGRSVLPGVQAAYAGTLVLLPGLAVLLLLLLLGPRTVAAVSAGYLPGGAVPSLALSQIAGNRDALPAELAPAAAVYRQLSNGLALALPLGALLAAGIGFALARRRMAAAPLSVRPALERIVTGILIACTAVALLTTVGIFAALGTEAWRFFARYPLGDFLFGLHWSPQTALRPDQVGSSGSFGAVPLFAGTALIAGIALAVALPIGMFCAIWTAEYAGRRARNIVKPVLEMLAGVPTVVFGFFAAVTVGHALQGAGAWLGLPIAAESALAAGLTMGIMIVPYVSSLADDVIRAVPAAMRDGAMALGATKAETVRQVVLPAAASGLVGAVLLAASRAIGETMIVVMAAGLTARLSANPLDSVTTVTVQIKQLLVGDQEFDSAKTLSAFALGLVLFAVTLALNLLAQRIVHAHRALRG